MQKKEKKKKPYLVLYPEVSTFFFIFSTIFCGGTATALTFKKNIYVLKIKLKTKKYLVN